MSSIVRVSLGLLFLTIFSLDPHSSVSVGVFARSIVKRAYMEYDSMVYQPPPEPTSPPQSSSDHRTHIVKIHPKKSGRSNDLVISDVTNFRGIGGDHNAFGGPSYAADYYPTVRDQGDHARASNFSFGNLLSGLALWNLANEFNMYSSQDRQLVSSGDQQVDSSSDHQVSLHHQNNLQAQSNDRLTTGLS